jgi:hypothetical protein
VCGHPGSLRGCGAAEALDFVETVSKNELLINKKKQQYDELAVPKYIISPHGKFRVRWDLVSVSLICCKLLALLC